MHGRSYTFGPSAKRLHSAIICCHLDSWEAVRSSSEMSMVGKSDANIPGRWTRSEVGQTHKRKKKKSKKRRKKKKIHKTLKISKPFQRALEFRRHGRTSIRQLAPIDCLIDLRVSRSGIGVMWIWRLTEKLHSRGNFRSCKYYLSILSMFWSCPARIVIQKSRCGCPTLVWIQNSWDVNQNTFQRSIRHHHLIVFVNDVRPIGHSPLLRFCLD